MRQVQLVAVVGLGLIGGSLARDLAARGVRVLGADRERGVVDAAMEEGVVEPLDADLGGLDRADAVVVAVPVSETPALLELIAGRARRARVVMDVGSTKRTAIAAAERSGLAERFVGAHPLAGDHRSGWSASRRALFDGARVFLTPAPAAGGEAVDLAAAIWSAVGAMPERIDAEAHDRLLARTSHLHQIVATALGLTMAAEAIPRRELGPGGEAMTRLAGSSPEMWSAVCDDNAAAVAEALDALRRQLDRVGAALERNDRDELRALFGEAEAWFGEGRAT